MEPRPLDSLELAAIWRALDARAREYRALLEHLERRRYMVDAHEHEHLAELERLANRVREVATVGGFTLAAAQRPSDASATTTY